MNSDQFITFEQQASHLTVILRGGWVSGNSRSIETAAAGEMATLSLPPPTGDGSACVIDVSGIQAMDTYGAWLVERLRRELGTSGTAVEITGLSGQHQPLLRLIEGVNRHPSTLKPPSGIARFFRDLSSGISSLLNDLMSFAGMTGALTAAAGKIIRSPRRFRLTSVVHQLDKVGWQAVPIIALITLLIGGIIAQQGFFHFGKLGADLYVVDMVGILVLREVGILLVAIMVAGRSGSAYTAELGSMKMREEIDALRTMGLNPVEILILPRVLMLVLAVPLLTFIGSMAALYGGGLVAYLYGGMTPEIFIHRLKEAISLTHFNVGMIKAPFMGFVIGVVACTEGLKVAGSAESLGRHTTRSVVKSIFMVIVLDGLFAIFFASIGM